MDFEDETAVGRPRAPQKRTQDSWGGGDDVLVFVHIQKTAGLTVRKILHRQYGGRKAARLVDNYFSNAERSVADVRSLVATPPPGLRAIHGHVLFWPDEVWPVGSRFVTLLRDPVERTISHYSWLRVRNAKFRLSLQEALADGAIPDNLQTRVLSADTSPFGRMAGDSLERAINNLERFTVVGLTERFDHSLVLLTRAFGWQRMLYGHENATPGRQPRESLSPETLKAIQQYNALDRNLYQEASRQFDRHIASEEDDFHIEVAALKRARARIAIGDDRSLDPLPSTIAGREPFSADSRNVRDLLIEAQADLLIREEARLALLAESKRSVTREKARHLGEQVSRLQVELLKARIRIDEMARTSSSHGSVVPGARRGPTERTSRQAALRRELLDVIESADAVRARYADLRHEIAQLEGLGASDRRLNDGGGIAPVSPADHAGRPGAHRGKVRDVRQQAREVRSRLRELKRRQKVIERELASA